MPTLKFGECSGGGISPAGRRQRRHPDAAAGLQPDVLHQRGPCGGRLLRGLPAAGDGPARVSHRGGRKAAIAVAILPTSCCSFLCKSVTVALIPLISGVGTGCYSAVLKICDCSVDFHNVVSPLLLQILNPVSVQFEGWLIARTFGSQTSHVTSVTCHWCPHTH